MIGGILQEIYHEPPNSPKFSTAKILCYMLFLEIVSIHWEQGHRCRNEVILSSEVTLFM